MNREKDEVCENCVAYASPIENNGDIGQCRLEGPRAQIVPAAGQLRTHGFWPPVQPRNWCLKFQHRTNH